MSYWSKRRKVAKTLKKMTEKCNDNSYMDYQTAKPTNAPSVESACKSCCCNTDTPLNENFDKKFFTVWKNIFHATLIAMYHQVTQFHY